MLTTGSSPLWLKVSLLVGGLFQKVCKPLEEVEHPPTLATESGRG